ncbi:MAG: oligosaccharide flippase family protein [Bacteroidetes bacterium]|nr:oligosaccharide flippase family protein [Bacteroidota bacterium]
MISYLRNKVESFWNNGHERTLKIKRNIVYSFGIKGASVIIGLLLIPLTINYVNTVQYGIWLTISSLVAWINNFDIGLANGLRNKMAHALAMNEEENVVKYVSTTYAIIFLISVGFFLLFFLGGSFLNWNSMLNVTGSVSFNLWPIVAMTLASFCVQFALQPIKTMLIAMHQPFMSSLILLLGQALTFILTYLLTLFTKSSLMYLVLVSAWSPVLIYLLANVYLFSTSLKQYRPRFSAIDMSSARSLLNMGWAFFFLQMGALILYQTDNIVLTRVISPDAVTTFNIAFKYFYVVTTAFAIILTPYWSAFTDAYAKKDMAWIKNSIQKMRIIWLVFTVATVFFYIFAKLFYRIWIGSKIDIPNLLSLTMAVYTIFNMWQGIYSYALNGMGKLRVQLIFIGGGGIINIPLSIWLIHLVGVSGTVLANIAVITLMDIAYTYQVNLIIAGKAKGILNR